jgi:hypothetical protein
LLIAKFYFAPTYSPIANLTRRLMPPICDLSLPAVRHAWTRELLTPIDEAKFDQLARQLFAWQVARVPAFRRLCEGHGVSPKNLRSWKDIPAVPQQLFKREKLFAHGNHKPATIYETSGTTTGQPGRQHLLSTDIYRTVSIEGARRAGLLDLKHLHFLAFSPTDKSYSSLSAMFGFWLQNTGGRGARFWVSTTNKDGTFYDFAGMRKTLAKLFKAGQPVGLAGTAIAFAVFLDSYGKSVPRVPLPDGSWVLETGGFKGLRREVSKAELYAGISTIFSVPNRAIWNEYGMSELSSQAYARGTNGLHYTPPWARVLVVNPATNREVAVGKQGLVRWIDLANTDSVLAVQTLDVAERTPKGFRLIGRLPRTEPRGCSLGVDDLLPRKEAA